MACRLCSHPRREHLHFTSSRHCSRWLGGHWCPCGEYESALTSGIRWAAAVATGWVVERVGRDAVQRADDAEAALRNVLLFGRFADPTRLPLYPVERRTELLHLIPRKTRFIPVPAQRHNPVAPVRVVPSREQFRRAAMARSVAARRAHRDPKGLQ